MKIQIIERQPAKVVCQHYTGPLGEPVGKFWRSEVTPWLADHGLLDCPRYGIALDESRYDACVELPNGLELPDAEQTTIAGGRYAVTTFKGTSAEIGAAWGAFIAAVLADSTNRVDKSRRPYEHYPRGASHDGKTGIFSCELCIPLGG